MQDYPGCIDLEFWVSFSESITDEIELIKDNYHTLTHFESLNPLKIS